MIKILMILAMKTMLVMKVLLFLIQIKEFITNLFLSKKTSISNYLRETDPYNPLIWSPSLDDDEDEDEVDDSYEVVKKSKKSKKK